MLFFVYLSSIFLLLSAVLVLKKIKIATKTQKLTMGGWFSYVWWGGNPDVVNPVSGLSKREVYAVQKSWAPVIADQTAMGNEILRRFYRACPEGKDFFRMVRNKPEEEYESNPQFKAHVISLMTSLNMVVINLNQPEVVIALLNKLGESHGKRKIQEKHFMILKKVVVEMYIELLHMDKATLGAWDKTVDFWYKHIFETLGTSESR